MQPPLSLEKILSSAPTPGRPGRQGRGLGLWTQNGINLNPMVAAHRGLRVPERTGSPRLVGNLLGREREGERGHDCHTHPILGGDCPSRAIPADAQRLPGTRGRCPLSLPPRAWPWSRGTRVSPGPATDLMCGLCSLSWSLFICKTGEIRESSARDAGLGISECSTGCVFLLICYYPI